MRVQRVEDGVIAGLHVAILGLEQRFEDVRAIAGPATVLDDWAVARAIERGQAAQALRELALVLDGGAAPYMVLGQLAWVARTKLPPGRVSPAVEAMFETDLALKSSAGDQRVLLERLVLEMCGVGLPRSAGASS